MEVIVYSIPTCGWCKKLKAWLKENDVSFEDRDVTESDKFRDELIEKSGQMGVPVLSVNGKITIGFDEEKLKEMFSK